MRSGSGWLAVGVAAAWGLVAGSAGASGSGGRTLAYVDPGAGSFVLQALVAAMAGIVVALNVYWRKIKRFLGLGSDPAEAESPTVIDPADD